MPESWTHKSVIKQKKYVLQNVDQYAFVTKDGHATEEHVKYNCACHILKNGGWAFVSRDNIKQAHFVKFGNKRLYFFWSLDTPRQIIEVKLIKLQQRGYALDCVANHIEFIQTEGIKPKLDSHFMDFVYGSLVGNDCILLLNCPMDTSGDTIIIGPTRDNDFGTDIAYEFLKLQLSFAFANCKHERQKAYSQFFLNIGPPPSTQSNQ